MSDDGGILGGGHGGSRLLSEWKLKGHRREGDMSGNEALGFLLDQQREAYTRLASMLRRLEWSTQRLSPGTVIPYPACPVCYAPARTHLPVCDLAALLRELP